MKKIISLIKASMTEGMNLFRVSTQKKNTFTKVILPTFLYLLMMGIMFGYSEMFIEALSEAHMEYVVLSLFIVATSIITLVEGIYKSSGLLFNCKDDNMLLSLPISRRTVLFVRVFKFYIFELLYNSIFLAPSMICYAIHVNPGWTYYMVSIIGLLLFPIVPILASCTIGAFITLVASRFKGKNQIQTILSVIFLLGIMYVSYNGDNLMMNLAGKASSINDYVTRVYYPAGAYIELVRNFNIVKLIEFVAVHIVLFDAAIVLIGRFYFNINSSVKSIKKGKINKNYVIRTLSPMKSLIKKEFNRFINSPVFVANAGFGLVLYVLRMPFYGNKIQ